MGEGNTVLVALLLLSPSWWCGSTPRTQAGQRGVTVTPVWSFFLSSSVRCRRCGAEPSWGPVRSHLPSPSSPVGSPQFFVLCLPIKAASYSHKRHMERVSHRKQPAFIHTPECRQILPPAWHCDPRYTENLFPLQCSKSYRKRMALRNGECPRDATFYYYCPYTTQHPQTRAE